MWCSGFGVEGLEFWVGFWKVLGFRLWGLGVGDSGVMFEVCDFVGVGFGDCSFGSSAFCIYSTWHYSSGALTPGVFVVMTVVISTYNCSYNYNAIRTRLVLRTPLLVLSTIRLGPDAGGTLHYNYIANWSRNHIANYITIGT